MEQKSLFRHNPSALLQFQRLIRFTKNEELKKEYEAENHGEPFGLLEAGKPIKRTVFVAELSNDLQERYNSDEQNEPRNYVKRPQITPTNFYVLQKENVQRGAVLFCTVAAFITLGAYYARKRGS